MYQREKVEPNDELYYDLECHAAFGITFLSVLIRHALLASMVKAERDDSIA